MTLLISERLDNDFRLYSDSRLSIGGRYADVGSKLLSVRCKVTSPNDGATGNCTVLYDHSIGIGYTGQTTLMFCLHAFLSNALSKLQVSSFNAVGFEFVADMVSRSMLAISRTLAAAEAAVETDVIIMGWCPIRNQVVSYVLQASDEGGVSIAKKELDGNGVEFWGAGATRAEADFKLLMNRMDIFHFMRDFIGKGKIPCVGGSIQYGHFEGFDFVVRGVQDKEWQGSDFRYTYSFGGVELDLDGSEGAIVSGRYECPFIGDPK